MRYSLAASVNAGLSLAVVGGRAAWYSLWCMSAAMFSLMIAFAIRDAEASA